MQSLRLTCLFSLMILSVSAGAQSIQFEYDLKITADPAKRAAYLKQSGEAPSPYEQVLSLIKGSMQVATIVDKVDLRKDQYRKSSTGTLMAVLSTVLNDQKLILDSAGSIGPNGFLTFTYQEKRGGTELLIVKVDAPKKVINFYKVSSRNPPTDISPFYGQMLAMISVDY